MSLTHQEREKYKSLQNIYLWVNKLLWEMLTVKISEMKSNIDENTTAEDATVLENLSILREELAAHELKKVLALVVFCFEDPAY